MANQPNNINAGTQVVARLEVRGPGNSLVHPRSAVGVVTRTPAVAGEKYLVRFPDGFETSLAREQLDVLKHFKDRLGEVGRVTPCAPVFADGHQTTDGSQRTASPTFDFESFIIYRCVVGSRAYGLAIHPTRPATEADALREEPPVYRAQPKPTKRAVSPKDNSPGQAKRRPGSKNIMDASPVWAAEPSPAGHHVAIVLAMTFDLAKILQSKREYRQRLAARPVAEKLAIRPTRPTPEADALREEPPVYRAQPKPAK